MKAKLEFEFDLLEDRKQLELILKADDLASIINELLCILRNYTKYNQHDKKDIKTANDAFEHIYQIIYDCLQEKNISLEDL